MKKKNKNYIFYGLLLLTFSMAVFLLVFFKYDSDYFWHIKAGEYMAKNGVLKHDVFSWYLNSKYWMSHEWLFEIIIYKLKLLFGNYHVFVYSFVCIFSLILLLFLANKNNYLKNIPFTLMWYLFFFIMIIFYIQVRPHMFSFVLLAITIYVLYDLYKNEESRKIFVLPFVTILWANFHGGSSNLPYLFCLIFMICGLFSFNKSKIIAKRLSKKQFFKYFFIMLICMISVCINLHGFKMFIYPYENMANKLMLSNISEWRNTSLSEASHYVYFIFLLLIIFVMLFSRKKIELMDLVLLGVATFLGLKSIRFWIYLYIVMSFIIFDYIEKRKLDKGTFACITILSIFLLGFFMVNSNNILSLEKGKYLDKKIIKVIKKENPKKLYNMYNYGGELIYNDIDVFIDGRADLYSKYNYEDYLNISNLKDDYVKLIDKYEFDYFLVDKKYPINTYLKYNDSYEIIHKNDKLVLYKKIKS